MALIVSRISILLVASAALSRAIAADLFVEAESFTDQGGWTLDTQFIELMGSPYLLAHGMGRPVADAETTVNFAQPGTYHLFARTEDWVAHWNAAGAPGKFQVSVDGRIVPHLFGTTNAEWSWEKAGTVKIPTPGQHRLALHDLTGFDGRCDALFFTTDAKAHPPETRHERKALLGLPDTAPETAEYDLVVC